VRVVFEFFFVLVCLVFVVVVVVVVVVVLAVVVLHSAISADVTPPSCHTTALPQCSIYCWE